MYGTIGAVVAVIPINIWKYGSSEIVFFRGMVTISKKAVPFSLRTPHYIWLSDLKHLRMTYFFSSETE